MDLLNELGHGHDDEVLEVDATVGVLAESGAFLGCCVLNRTLV